MNVVYCGSAQFGIPSLEAVASSRHKLVGVFTQPARPAGRHRDPKPTDVACWCAARGIACVEADNINTPEIHHTMAACGGDLLIVIAFGQKIGRPLIEMHRFGAINIHGSLLPRYRGAAPIHWALMRGETETGVSIITLAQRMDSGQILAQAKTAIEPNDTFLTLHDRLSVLSAPLLLETMEAIEAGRAVYAHQDETHVTYAPKMTKADGYIDWQRPAVEIANQTRALSPWPGAQSVYVSAATGRSWRVIIDKASVVEKTNALGDVPGMLDDHLNVICGWNRLNIIDIKPAGSDKMSFEAFARGRNCQPGDLFLPIEKVLQGIVQ